MIQASMTFKEGIELATRTGIKEEKKHNGVVILVLNDGSELHFESHYDEGYSDVTPGEGIQPPTVTWIEHPELLVKTQEGHIVPPPPVIPPEIEADWAAFKERFKEGNQREMTDAEYVFYRRMHIGHDAMWYELSQSNQRK